MSKRNIKKVRIGIFGTYGFENMGDAAVADATIAGLKRHIPNAEVVGICQQPENVSARHHIEAYSIFRVFIKNSESVYHGEPIDDGRPTFVHASSIKDKLIRLLKSSGILFRIAKIIGGTIHLLPDIFREFMFTSKILKIVRTLDLIVMSGSGQLNEEWGGPWRYPFALFRWCLLARITGCKIAFLSVGAGEIHSPWAKFFCSSALRLAHYKSIRDVGSKNLVESWGVRHVNLVPDMAFSMKFEPDSNIAEKYERPLVGINPISFCDPRTWSVPDEPEYKKYISKLSAFCDWLISQDYSLAFIPNELVMDNLAIDDIISEIDIKLKNESTIKRPKVFEYRDVFNSLAKCDYVISCRFHGLLFSFMSKKPVIALAHHYKFLKLAEEMGQGGYCRDIATFELEDLKKLFQSMVSNKEAIAQAIAERSDRYAELVERQYEKIGKLASE